MSYPTNSDRERLLIRACEIANEDPELLEIEREFDALSDPIDKPWDVELLRPRS